MEELRRERKTILIEYRTINNDAISPHRAHRVLRNECTVYLLRTSLQERIKRRTDRTFVSNALLFILRQRSVIISDSLMIRFQIKSWHAGIIANFGRYVKYQCVGCVERSETQHIWTPELVRGELSASSASRQQTTIL